MTTQLNTRLEIKSWDEQPYQELDGDRKFTQAKVVVAGDGLEGTWTALMYYRGDGTSTYVGLMQLTGRLGERTGSFVMESTGVFDGTSARVDLAVVPDSGTEELAGISGTAASVSTHGDYPYWPMILDYDIA
jgi:hypothetical protein